MFIHEHLIAYSLKIALPRKMNPLKIFNYNMVLH